MKHRAALVPALLLCFGACDDPAEPDRVRAETLDVAIEAPTAVQAEDSFDIAVQVSNQADRPSAALTLNFCYRPTGLHCAYTDVATLGEIDGDDTEATVIRVALTAQEVMLGGAGDLVVCVNDGHTGNCATSPVTTAPDLAALCEPDVISLPLTDQTDTYACGDHGPGLIVLAIDAEAGHGYTFDVEGVPSFSFRIFDEDGEESLDVGSRPDGKFFLAGATERHYVVVLAPNHFTFSADDAGPM